MPEELEMPVTIPLELGPVAAVLAELRKRVRAVEDERAAERQRTGRRVLGRRAVLGQSWRERPRTSEPRRNLRPQVASRSRWVRIEALLRDRAFAAEYADARERWRAGIPAVFPPGTYWLQRFASVTVLRRDHRVRRARWRSVAGDGDVEADAVPTRARTRPPRLENDNGQRR